MKFKWLQTKNGRKLRFRFPKLAVTKEAMKHACTLPTRFCGICSLREGAAVMITVVQMLMSLALTIALLLLEHYSHKIDTWWEKKLDTDFKPAFGNPQWKEYARDFMHVWRKVAWTVVIICASYLFTGVLVIIGLIFKRSSLWWFALWILYTIILIVTSYTFVILEISFVIIFTMQREVTITQEVMPIVVSIVFAVIWTYAFIIIFSHVKRRYKTNKLAKLIKAKVVLSPRV